ncbi:MAG: dehypoxanthine futalosine cyclase [Marinilabiliales bacterium]|nr:MAG: dehypoxanthine futalosine cyclase [Marinilabiliales bacterium]
MNREGIIEKALNGGYLTMEEGVELYENESLSNLMAIAHILRERKAKKEVGWIIDRNVNITNACLCRCRFCNFHRKPGSNDIYVTGLEDYNLKIRELFDYGGDQLLLQGGLHPDLGLDFYTDLFARLKADWPDLKLHALGPPEIVHLSKIEGLSYAETIKKLVESGMNSLPGAGAEILVDRVREIISPAKCTSEEWLNVMREVHKMGLVTSATMMLGHVETVEERLEHLIRLREVQDEKPEESPGFVAFIPWPFQSEGTVLEKKGLVTSTVSQEEYIRMIAISRIMLPNIINIQASWLTVGIQTAQVCLHAGANDLGSVMIEENVVSSAGANYTLNAAEMVEAIEEAGFEPRRRNQDYTFLE